MTSKLSQQEQLFVEHFLALGAVEGKATEAARQAGYAPNSAHVAASRLLSRDKVRAAVRAGVERVLEPLNVTAENVLKEIAVMAFAPIMGPGAGLVDQGVKLRALERLGDNLGLFKPIDEREDHQVMRVIGSRRIEDIESWCQEQGVRILEPIKNEDAA